MPDSIKFEGTDYEVKRKLSFGEVRKFQKVLGSLLGMDERIRTATDEQLQQIANEGIKASDEQMEIISDTLLNCLGFPQEKIDIMDFPTAVVLFNEVFNSSTMVKKKLNQPYA